jgi:hypothetical protein
MIDEEHPIPSQSLIYCQQDTYTLYLNYVIRFALCVIMNQANVHCVHHFNIKIIISDMDKEVPENANQH